MQTPQLPLEPLPAQATYLPGARTSSRYWFSGFSVQLGASPDRRQAAAADELARLTSSYQVGPGRFSSDIPEM